MRNFLLVIFAKIWPKTMYYSTGTLTRFLSNLLSTIVLTMYNLLCIIVLAMLVNVMLMMLTGRHVNNMIYCLVKIVMIIITVSCTTVLDVEGKEIESIQLKNGINVHWHSSLTDVPHGN